MWRTRRCSRWAAKEADIACSRMPVVWGLARDYAARGGDREKTPVTEAEWLAATDPVPMLKFLHGKTDDRRLRLFAVACCRKVRRALTNERCRSAVEAAERFAEGESDERELRTATLGMVFHPTGPEAAAILYAAEVVQQQHLARHEPG